ncbi:MAG: hypothetical protein EHM87_19880 [Burkholderiales bacterium]|nr:MAG: hypothetical protein EHM87_19880 [Burkholderiales bacterium]
MLHRLLALRPLLFHACVPSDFESIRRDRAIRASVADAQGVVPGGVAHAPHEAVDRAASHVQFWPGSLQGPISGGRERIERLRRPEGLRLLRAHFTAVLQRNPARECHVAFAAGASLQSIHAGRWNAADVQEVAFTGFVDLPLDTLWADTLEGPWRPL